MILTQTDFIKIASWSEEKMFRYCIRLTQKLGHQGAVDHLMKLRLAMQKELSTYSKGKSFDFLQRNALVTIENILRWCKDYFMKWAVTEVIKKHPEKATSPVSIKYVARKMWEEYVKRWSY